MGDSMTRGFTSEDTARPSDDDDESEGNEPVVVDTCARGVGASGNALLVRRDNGIERWIPHVCIHADSEVFQANTSGKLIVKRWWARKRGWTE